MESTNSPDSTTSLSGVVFGFGEIERSGLAFQSTLLLFVNMQRLWFHLTVTHHRQKLDSQLMSMTAVSAVGRGVALCPLFCIWTRTPTRQNFLQSVGNCWWQKWSDSEVTVQWRWQWSDGVLVVQEEECWWSKSVLVVLEVQWCWNNGVEGVWL